MRKEIADLWVKALRSGEFPQAKGFLDRNGYCPMGLLSVLAMTLGVCDYTQTKKGGAYDNELGRVPVSVQAWAELYGQSGEIRGEFCNITYLFDKLNFTFDEIADIIEKDWEKI